jgi:hypothetical protein
MHRRRIIQLGIPAALVGVGIVLLSSCIPLPIETDQWLSSGPWPRIHKQVGSAKGDKPVRVGVSSRPQVESHFGLPHYQTADGRAVVYKCPVATWQSFFPLCFMSTGMNSEDRFLLLRFGADGRVEGYEVFKSLDKLTDKTGLSLREVPRPKRFPVRELPATRSTAPAPLGLTYPTRSW